VRGGDEDFFNFSQKEQRRSLAGQGGGAGRGRFQASAIFTIRLAAIALTAYARAP
jgi:hypothetical protein